MSSCLWPNALYQAHTGANPTVAAYFTVQAVSSVLDWAEDVVYPPRDIVDDSESSLAG